MSKRSSSLRVRQSAKPHPPLATAIHRVFGSVTPIQRLTTSGGTPAILIRCADGHERTIALSQEYWTTTITKLLAVSTEPPKRTRKPKAETDGLATLETRIENCADDLAELQEECEEEFEEITA